MLENVYYHAIGCGFCIENNGSKFIEIRMNDSSKVSVHLAVDVMEQDKYTCSGAIYFGEGKQIKSEMIHINKEVSSEREVNILLDDIRTTVKTINSFINSQQELF
jgi:hypothetical protein